jgi:hypothetical protein
LEVAMEIKYELMGARPFLLVPVFDERVKDCPLDSVGAVVYAYLVYLARNKNSARQVTSRTGVALSLRLDKKAVDKAVGLLIEGGLVQEQGTAIQAVEPGEGSRGWFRRRERDEGEWFEGFVYDRVFLPRSSTVLSVRTNHLFWHLVRISYAVSRMPGHHMVGKHPETPPKYLTAKYLANGLNCDPRTVTRGLKRLQRLKLIKIQFWKQKKFVVGIPPLRDVDVHWRDDWNRVRREVEPPPEITAESLFAVPSPERLEPAVEIQSDVELFAKSYGIRGKILEEIITKVVKNRVSPREWMPVLKLAGEIHSRNHEKDPKQYPMRHCGLLFKNMLADLVTELNARKVVSEFAGKPETYAQMESRKLLYDLRLTFAAEGLLRQAIKEESLPLRGGGCIPCRLSWEDVQEVATKAGKDYGKFRDGIVSRVFGSSKNAPVCPWYVAWIREEQIPEWDDGALAGLGVSQQNFRRIREHAEELVRKICDSAEGVKFRNLANVLIKYGCKESTGSSLEDVRQGIVTAFHRVMRKRAG